MFLQGAQTDYPCLLDPRYTFLITHSQSSVLYNICKLTRRKNGGPSKELTSVKPIENNVNENDVVDVTSTLLSRSFVK